MGTTLKAILFTLLLVVIVFIAASLLDIALVVIYSRFYTTATFVVLFGVGGIFANIIAYSGGMQYGPENKKLRAAVIATMAICGCIFCYPLSFIEGGEYAAAFMSFGVTLTLTCILYLKKIL